MNKKAVDVVRKKALYFAIGTYPDILQAHLPPFEKGKQLIVAILPVEADSGFN